MAFTNPRENLESLELREGMSVADLGAGSGGYALPAASLVGDSGKVYAIDIQNSLLSKIQSEAKSRGLSNIEVIWSDLEKDGGTGLRDKSLDVLIASNLLFLIENKNAFIEEARRVLRPAGRVLVVEWADSFGGLGPQKEHLFLEEAARELFRKGGFEIEKTLFNAGEHHYGFIARKKN